MTGIDIVFAIAIAFSAYDGFKKGLFVELASFVSIIIGTFVAIKFSGLTKDFITSLISINPKYTELVCFIITFLVVVIGIYLLAKIFTKIADFASLGWMNTLAGIVLSVLKTVLILSMLISIFEKINVNHYLISKETLDQSILYNPINKTGQFVFPKLSEWYQKELKKTNQ